MNYLDANFATALHFNIQGQTDVAKAFTRKSSSQFVFSELAELECRRSFILQSGSPNSENWVRLQTLVNQGHWRLDPIRWRELADKSGQLIDSYGSSLRAGTLDTLHVAQCILSGCRSFLSFDTKSNARVLAASCRITVFPELSPTEKGRIIR